MAGIRTRKRGKSWYFAFEAKKLNGKQKVIERGGFKTEREAINAGIKEYGSYQIGNIALISEKVSLGDFLQSWLEVKKREVRPGTHHSYIVCVNRLTPLIGNLEVQKLRSRDVDFAITSLANKDLSKGTLINTLTTLKEALNYACYPCEFIQTNPAIHIKVPKFAPKQVVKREIITPQKLQEIFTVFPFRHPYHIPLQIAYHTGMRIGEVLRLCWDAVDLERGKIRVIRQLRYTPETGHYFGAPKTTTSVRTVLLDSQIIALLKNWKIQQTQNELETGARYLRVYEDEKNKVWQMSKNHTPPESYILRQLVCTNKKGNVIPEISICQKLKALGINSHSLRHTHATNLIEGGAKPKDVATRLGHSDATITQNLYTHDTEKLQEETLRIFEGMLARC